MKRLNDALKKSLIIGSIIASLILIYIISLPPVVHSEIKLSEHIPVNIKIGENPSSEGLYAESGAEPFNVSRQENISFFENRKLVSFAKTSFDPKTGRIWFLIRGTGQEELPKVFDYYREFEEPPIKSGFLYRSSNPSLVETRGPSEPFSNSQLCNNCHSGIVPAKYKIFSIELSRTRDFMNSASAILGGGIIIAFLAFIALMRSDKKKIT